MNHGPSSDSFAGRRVLVIEDEALVAMMLEDVLAELGCNVAAIASQLPDAMEKAKSLAFDLAVLDVNLGGHRSFAVAEILAKRGVPFVFSTGYGAGALPDGMQRIPLLQKPFQLHELERALRVVLGLAA